MTFPAGVSLPGSATADPFGLWQAPRPGSGGVSYGGVGEAAAGDTPALVWSLDLSSAAGGRQALALRERQVRALQAGLEQAERRMDALLAARAAARAQPGAVSFGQGAPQALAPPERFLAQALDQLDPPAGQVSYGLGEELAKIDWPGLRARLAALYDSVNRQVLHYAWVDTHFDGSLSARTVVEWSGDLATCCRLGLAPAQLDAHRRSLALALETRRASLTAIITVARLAAKIILALTTPLGAVQALALAWEFVSSIVLPMVRGPS